jgi:hypothetical protein
MRFLTISNRQGFLDTVSEEKLDEVDAIVFSPDVPISVRIEALLFLMDHTEGFSESDLEQTQKLSKKGKKGTDKAAVVDLKRKHNALQLETLTEFAEHHLNENYEYSSFLAEAILQTPKADLLFDWETIVSLLMRETDDMISQQLRPNQISILLTMFITTVKYLYSFILDEDRDNIANSTAQVEISQLFEANNSIISLKPNSNRHLQEIDNCNEEYERFNEIMLRRLPSLLTRFKDNIRHLQLLSEILLCLNIPNQKKFQDFQLIIEDLFLLQNDMTLLRNIVIGLKCFLNKRIAIADMVKRFTEKLALTSWNAYLQAEKQLQSFYRKNVNSSSRKSQEVNFD